VFNASDQMKCENQSDRRLLKVLTDHHTTLFI